MSPAAPGAGPAPPDRRRAPGGALRRPTTWLALLGGLGALLAAAMAPARAAASARQDWSPFVLVAGLLLVGLVAEVDGLFAAAGRLLVRLTGDGLGLVLGAALLVALVTAVLNLDTSVAFVTPVLAYAAARRPPVVPFALGLCLLLSNAGSLLLPGSNLTNLIVLGRHHLSGGRFLAEAAPAWAAAGIVTVALVAFAAGRALRQRSGPAAEAAVAGAPVTGTAVAGTAAGTPGSPTPAGTDPRPRPPRSGSPHPGGLLAVAGVTVAVVLLPSPALPVLGIGLLAALVRLGQGATSLRRIGEVLGPAVLVGLFGLAVALGTLGRASGAPASLLQHLDPLGTAVLGALGAVALNNLPAASLLAAGAVPHPLALLVGLNVGPNLFVTGSLSWVLWRRSAAQAGAIPPLRQTVALGLLSAPLALLAAVGALALAH
ncbi:SLC13 family permease [Aciditerrimonas ferrireducens]|uniref:SLC13 family permease n=1 Tax=Aciditerrimonas ferrireducens TaxID=667306 RepID=UPI002004967B|nr:SLC13 family permease [Aciditerrimonas ferrireducens]MCK4177874.1 hypothetical protein [Aciditerrimonas ferrireducens]